MPSEKQLHEIIHCCVLAREDASPKVMCVAHEFRRYREHLYCLPPLAPVDPGWTMRWNMQQDLVLPYNLGVLKQDDIGLQDLCNIKTDRVTVRFGQYGDVVQSQKKKWLLKKWFQHQGIPPWWRDRIPLVCVNDDCYMPLGLSPNLL